MVRYILALALLASACDKPAPTTPAEEPTPEQPAALPSTAAQTAAQKAVEPAPTSDAFKTSKYDNSMVDDFTIDVKGAEILAGLRFEDKNGDNLFAVYRNKNLDLFASHIILGEDARLDRQIREIKQLRGDCEWDYNADIVKGTVAATDLDQDGYGEITLAYKFACRSDMSPQDYRVLILENGEKSILRGFEILIVGDEEPFGDGKFEPEGFENSPTLLEHAKDLWKRNILTRF